MSELLERYQAEAVRLQGLIARHQSDRKRVRLFLWGLFLAPFGFFFHPIAAAGVVFVVLALYFTSLYLSSMHYWDCTDQLRRVTRELAKLEERA